MFAKRAQPFFTLEIKEAAKEREELENKRKQEEEQRKKDLTE